MTNHEDPELIEMTTSRDAQIAEFDNLFQEWLSLPFGPERGEVRAKLLNNIMEPTPYMKVIQ